MSLFARLFRRLIPSVTSTPWIEAAELVRRLGAPDVRVLRGGMETSRKLGLRSADCDVIATVVVASVGIIGS